MITGFQAVGRACATMAWLWGKACMMHVALKYIPEGLPQDQRILNGKDVVTDAKTLVGEVVEQSSDAGFWFEELGYPLVQCWEKVRDAGAYAEGGYEDMIISNVIDYAYDQVHQHKIYVREAVSSIIAIMCYFIHSDEWYGSLKHKVGTELKAKLHAFEYWVLTNARYEPNQFWDLSMEESSVISLDMLSPAPCGFEGAAMLVGSTEMLFEGEKIDDITLGSVDNPYTDDDLKTKHYMDVDINSVGGWESVEDNKYAASGGILNMKNSCYCC